MRKALLILGIMLLLTGCGGEETVETVADEALVAVSAQPKQIRVDLPEEAVLPAMEHDGGILYLCRNFDVSVQTLEGGDLRQTVRTLSGLDMEELTLLQTEDGTCTRTEFVWTAAGELGDQVCRAAVLDDGSYHYALTAMIAEDKARQYQQMWNGMFESFNVG